MAAVYFTRISRGALFWIAFILMRPFGATMGDLLTKAHDKGGLGFGHHRLLRRAGAVTFGIAVVIATRQMNNEKPAEA